MNTVVSGDDNKITISEVVEQRKDLYDKEGISGKVTVNATKELEYPNIKLIATKRNPEKYKLAILKSMLIGGNIKLYNTSDKILTVYIQPVGSKLQECGKIYQSQVRSLLKMFNEDMHVEVGMNEEMNLTGNYVYAMCN